MLESLGKDLVLVEAMVVVDFEVVNMVKLRQGWEAVGWHLQKVTDLGIFTFVSLPDGGTLNFLATGVLEDLFRLLILPLRIGVSVAAHVVVRPLRFYF